MYFLFIAVLSVIPSISTIDPTTAYLPVLFVIFFALMFDWYDDLKRYKNDNKTNNCEVQVIRDGQKMTLKSKKIKIGDFLEIKEGERAQADILLLSYTSTNNYCYIDTSSLDGEKTLKPKISIL